MIVGWLKGRVISVGADSALIDVRDVGYVVQAGTRLLSTLRPSETAEIHIETKVTDSSIVLYGFESDEARAWFVRLQDVPSVGGKAAMAVLDVLSPAELMDAIALSDAVPVTRAKGIGKKLAERIVGELSGKAPPMGRFGALPVAGSATYRSLSFPSNRRAQGSGLRSGQSGVWAKRGGTRRSSRRAEIRCR